MVDARSTTEEPHLRRSLVWLKIQDKKLLETKDCSQYFAFNKKFKANKGFLAAEEEAYWNRLLKKKTSLELLP